MAKKNQIEKTTDAKGVSTASFIMDAAQFNAQAGETFAGINVLSMAVGQCAGPFVITEILRNQQLSKKVKGKVDVYVTKAPDGTEVRMPAAASFVDKAKKAKLAVGDTILVQRNADYESKFGRDCESYALKVTKRTKV